MAGAHMVAVFEIGDFHAWKKRFDEDPVGRDELATGYNIGRGVENPSEVVLTIEFAAVADAQALLARLATAPPPPADEHMAVKVFPTIFEITDDSEQQKGSF